MKVAGMGGGHFLEEDMVAVVAVVDVACAEGAVGAVGVVGAVGAVDEASVVNGAGVVNVADKDEVMVGEKSI